MTEEEINVLREKVAKMRKRKRKPLTEEQEKEKKDFQERCESQSWGFTPISTADKK